MGKYIDLCYNYISPDGECLADWAAKGNLFLLYNLKDVSTFISGRWNTRTTPDLDFANEDLNSSELETPTLEKFLLIFVTPSPKISLSYCYERLWLSYFCVDLICIKII